VLESAGSDKVTELSKQLDLYNQAIQSRLYGSVGMDDEYEEEEYEEEEEEYIDEEEDSFL